MKFYMKDVTEEQRLEIARLITAYGLPVFNIESIETGKSPQGNEVDHIDAQGRSEGQVRRLGFTGRMFALIAPDCDFANYDCVSYGEFRKRMRALALHERPTTKTTPKQPIKEETMSKKEQAFDFIMSQKIKRIGYHYEGRYMVFETVEGEFFDVKNDDGAIDLLTEKNGSSYRPSCFVETPKTKIQAVKGVVNNSVLSVLGVPFEVTKNIGKASWGVTKFAAKRWRFAAFAAASVGIYYLNPEMFNDIASNSQDIVMNFIKTKV